MDQAVLREIGARRFIGADLPEELGAIVLDSQSTGIVVEELFYGDFNVGAYSPMQSLFAAAASLRDHRTHGRKLA